ncbi:unnamed protein product [Gongylonema pulchrum]|uniref:Uncharacterized protein n=1 Tax=Gongylonema pulchrum TaxID=637853 RepID=A0A3P7RLA3_9BILA|nr:unnamed protein product [Gongylonema pulchrum]
MPKVSHDKVTKLCRDVMVNAHKEHLYAVCHECIEAGRVNGTLCSLAPNAPPGSLAIPCYIGAGLSCLCFFPVQQ